MKVLVTGTGTPLGNTIANRLSDEHEVVSVDGSTDTRSPDCVGPLVSDVDAVVHAGATDDVPASVSSDEAELLDWASRSSYVLLDEGRKHSLRRCILMSSLSLFDSYPENYVIDESWSPAPGAGARKLAPLMAEHTFREFARQGPLQSICLRLGNLDEQDETSLALAADSVVGALALKIEETGYRWRVFHVSEDERFPMKATRAALLSEGDR